MQSQVECVWLDIARGSASSLKGIYGVACPSDVSLIYIFFFSQALHYHFFYFFPKLVQPFMYTYLSKRTVPEMTRKGENWA